MFLLGSHQIYSKAVRLVFRFLSFSGCSLRCTCAGECAPAVFVAARFCQRRESFEFVELYDRMDQELYVLIFQMISISYLFMLMQNLYYFCRKGKRQKYPKHLHFEYLCNVLKESIWKGQKPKNIQNLIKVYWSLQYLSFHSGARSTRFPNMKSNNMVYLQEKSTKTNQYCKIQLCFLCSQINLKFK